MHRIIYVILLVITAVIPGDPAFAKSIGVIMTADVPYYQEIHKAFLDAASATLSQQGYEVVMQKPVPDPMSWTNAARKLVTIGSDVIIAYGAPAALSLMKETSSIPIIFAGVYDPESMNMKVKNATGVSSTVPVEKAVRDLNGISKISKLGVVFSKSEKDTIIQVRDIKNTEAAIGFQSLLISIAKDVNKDEIKGADALLVTTCGVCMSDVKAIIEAARRDKIPTAALMGGAEHEGFIMTFAADPKEQGTELASILNKVLSGVKPANIPLIKPKKTLMTINLKEAKAAGLNIPANVLGSASKVLE